MSDERTVAVFDFDGTLTRRDTLLPFLRRTRGASRTSIALLANSLVLARGMVGDDDLRDAGKAAVLRHLLAGQNVDGRGAAAAVFADVVGRRALRPHMPGRVGSPQPDAQELVIGPAPPELYVAPIGERLGFHAVLGTRL